MLDNRQAAEALARALALYLAAVDLEHRRPSHLATRVRIEAAHELDRLSERLERRLTQGG